jgi:hypothetical protein
MDSPSIDKYLSEMTELEKKALEIAKEHLESSFSIEKSNGYIEWCKKEKEKK